MYKKKIIKNNGKRVIFRCHFDLAKNIPDEPIFHMQIGGHQRDGYYKEYFFLPNSFCVPRFHYPPLDLFLAIELILKHEAMEAFHYKESRIIDPHKSLDDLAHPQKLGEKRDIELTDTHVEIN